MKQFYSILIAFLIGPCVGSNPTEEEQCEFIKSDCNTLSDVDFDLDSIFDGMHQELEDSLWSRYWMPEHNRIIDELSAYKAGSQGLFPYSDFDSTVFVFYESPAGTEDVNDLRKRTVSDISLVCRKKRICY